MKDRCISSRRLCLQGRPSSGMALVIVLASLVFLVALGVAFLLNSTTELRSSRTYSEGGRAQMLAQSAVSLAMTQISDGAKGVDDANNPLAWASQPGMIRTYDAAGNAASSHKLYSWDVMTETGAFDATDASEQPPADWHQQKGIFTDLNEPVSSGTSKLYPIIDGNNLTLGITDSSGEQALTYDAAGQPAIAGFSISEAGTPAGPAGSNPIPMPVKWLYLLKQGQIVAPSGGSGNLATFSGANAPTDANPIVGRIAFWTDDETCKVNINTASEGVYWDTPRTKTAVEDALKTNQPVTAEYQRYPGHPAMTSLSTVLKKPAGSPMSEAQWAQYLYGLAPRIADGGSQAGTVNTAWAPSNAPTAVQTDSDRLYAGVDELIFDPNRTSNDPAPSNPQVLNQATLERARFFLTASSRSPDVNLFNKPRVCNWPITLEETSSDYPRPAPVTTPFDDLIAFCTTMRNDLGDGAFRYYFQRKNPDSPTVDLPATGGVMGLNRNRSLLEYLRSLTGQDIPGFGGNFAGKYGADNNQILTQMFDYIRGATNLMDSTLPAASRYTIGIPGVGVGTAWNGRLGQGQVVPIEDTTNGTRGFGRYRTVQGAALLFVGQIDGDDPVQPPPGTETSQVNLVTGQALAPTDAVPPGHIRVQAMFIPQFFSPAVGAPWNYGNFQWSVDLSELRWGPGNASMGFPPESTRYNQNQKSEDETAFGDQFGILQIRQARTPAGLPALALSAAIDLPKAAGSFSFSGGDVTVRIYAADRTANPPASNVEVQEVVMHFDAANFPLPALAPNDVAIYNNGLPTATKYNYRLFTRSPATTSGIYNKDSPGTPLPSAGGRAQAIDTASTWILDEDVMRSVRLKTGDARLVAAQKNVPASLFEVNPKYQTNEHVLGTHTFFDGYGRPYYGAALGRLVPGLNYFRYQPNAATFPGISTANVRGAYSFNLSRHTSAADVPFDGVAAGKSASFASGDIPGDWDNAPYTVRDGPFINKPDEGDMSLSASIAPYDWNLKSKAAGSITQTLFTPNREIPSPVMFGSLPTGVLANRPWQTLLFRPEPGHPGSKGYKGDGTAAPSMPPDHLLLDLFHMPVVEPYAISEPLSTAGRINMNFQIVPFTYINRDTGIRALLKSEKVISIRDAEAVRYKDRDATGQANIRLEVNADETLKGFLRRFHAEKGIFRSASEICELPIVPVDNASSDDSFETMEDYWSTRRLTGDNSRERIYATLYPRLTTKSNTFTIHFRAQALKKVAGTAADVWEEGRDQITGEFRGSQTVERYIDPNDTRIPDYANASEETPISSFYKFRVVQAKQFAP
jgi:uncharacterized protein (TIGR02600 family)